MKELTRTTIKYVDLFSEITDFKSDFVITKTTGKFSGINIRFDPELNLDDFPSIKKVMEKLQL